MVASQNAPHVLSTTNFFYPLSDHAANVLFPFVSCDSTFSSLFDTSTQQTQLTV